MHELVQEITGVDLNSFEDFESARIAAENAGIGVPEDCKTCLLYTSDAADE